MTKAKSSLGSTTVSVILGKSHKLPFIESNSWVRGKKSLFCSNYEFVTGLVSIEIGAFQDTHAVFCQMNQDNESNLWYVRGIVDFCGGILPEAVRSSKKLL